MDSLRRRLEWLTERLEKWKGGGDPQPVEREMAAIRWAIKTIEKHDSAGVVL